MSRWAPVFLPVPELSVRFRLASNCLDSVSGSNFLVSSSGSGIQYLMICTAELLHQMTWWVPGVRSAVDFSIVFVLHLDMSLSDVAHLRPYLSGLQLTIVSSNFTTGRDSKGSPSVLFFYHRSLLGVLNVAPNIDMLCADRDVGVPKRTLHVIVYVTLIGTS